MSTLTITGKDTLTLSDRIFNDLADGDVSTITFPNDLVSLKTGKDGNTLYALNETGKNAEMVIRVVRGSSDDKFLNSLLASMKRDIPSFEVMTGTFVKRLGDGTGVVISDTYNLEGGIFKKEVEAKDNAEGDTEQAVAVYNLTFAKGNRALG